MGSSRLFGKTLLPFGDGVTLLGHIVNRITQAFGDKSDIILVTSVLKEDDVIESWGSEVGLKVFRGSPTNVSQRILAAAEAFNLEEFIWILGDNPWVDPEQMLALEKNVRLTSLEYMVTPTPELVEKLDCKYSPTGTRLQFVTTSFFRSRFQKYRTAQTEEHTSMLFANLGNPKMVVDLPYGWPIEEIEELNVSINTNHDYTKALEVLDVLGEQAGIRDVFKAYAGRVS